MLSALPKHTSTPPRKAYYFLIYTGTMRSQMQTQSSYICAVVVSLAQSTYHT